MPRCGPGRLHRYGDLTARSRARWRRPVDAIERRHRADVAMATLRGRMFRMTQRARSTMLGSARQSRPLSAVADEERTHTLGNRCR